MMELLAPAFLGFLGLLVPLVLLYVLRQVRRERVVPSTLLWRAVLRDMDAAHPWQKLRAQVPLLLQALALVLGAIALARPVGGRSLPDGARLAIVIDASASMATRSAGRERLERARADALALAAGIGPGGRVMIIEAGPLPAVRSAWTNDPDRLARALATVAVRGGRADLEAAVALAEERMRGAGPGSRVVVLTDGASDEDVHLPRGDAPVELSRIEDGASNLGIVAADVRSRSEADAPDRCDVFVRVRNASARSATVFVRVSTEGLGLLATRRLDLAAGASEPALLTAVVPPGPDGSARLVRIELADANGTPLGDGLGLDDVVHRFAPGAAALPVVTVGPVPAPVLRVLRADRSVSLFAASPEAWARRVAEGPAFDGLVVLAGPAASALPAQDAVLIDPPVGTVGTVRVGAAVPSARAVAWAESDPRLRFVSLEDLVVTELHPLTGDGLVPLVTTHAGVAIAAVPDRDHDRVVLGFDPARSSFPSSPSFVVFFHNLVERARDRRRAFRIPDGALGEALRVPAPDGVWVEVTAPGGSESRVEAREGVALVPVPAEAGVFSVRVGERVVPAVRNLLDATESDPSARARITTNGGPVPTRAEAPKERTEAWPWLVLAVLGLLSLDVVWATRREVA